MATPCKEVPGVPREDAARRWPLTARESAATKGKTILDEHAGRPLPQM